MNEYISTQTAAKILEVANTTIHNYIKDGTIKDAKKKSKGLKMFSWVVSKTEIEKLKKQMDSE